MIICIAFMYAHENNCPCDKNTTAGEAEMATFIASRMHTKTTSRMMETQLLGLLGMGTCNASRTPMTLAVRRTLLLEDEGCEEVLESLLANGCQD
jgi:hypothetical protein